MVLLAALAVGLLLPGPAARAGGLQRPNQVGARAMGMGGAYTAVADDALSVWHNPAGLARINTVDLVLDLETVFILRSYRPTGRAKETASPTPVPAPLVAGGTRILVGKNAFISLGAGFYNSYGGSVAFDKSKVSEGVIRSQVALLELAPVIAYEVSKKVFIGAALRLGIGYLNALKSCSSLITCSAVPRGDPEFDTEISTLTGAGFGFSVGIQILPVDWLGLGLTYRSNLDVTGKRSNAVKSGGIELDASVTLPFPQSVSLGVFVKPTRRVILAAQIDWTDNSRWRNLFIDVKGWNAGPELINTPLHMKDSWTAHLGVEVDVSKRLVLRGGLAYDTQSIPDRYRVRELEDGQKLVGDLGATLRFGRWRLDLGAELLMGGVNHGFKSQLFPADYASPGRHFAGGTFSFHLGGGMAW